MTLSHLMVVTSCGVFMLLVLNKIFMFGRGGRVTVWEGVGVVGEILGAMWGAPVWFGCFDSRTWKLRWTPR